MPETSQLDARASAQLAYANIRIMPRQQTARHLDARSDEPKRHGKARKVAADDATCYVACLEPGTNACVMGDDTSP
jgi:hypothetical protein